MQPWPQASTSWYARDSTRKDGVRLIIRKTHPVAGPSLAPAQPGRVVEVGSDRLVVAAGEGAVRLLVMQLPGKKPMPTADFLRGHVVQEGDFMR
jgi:methionyl-tRNA formyltransferase